MAVIKTDKEQVKVEDNSEVREACKNLGIPFGCENGLCGTCLVKIEEGMENLTELTQEEKDMGVESPFRLMCQCIIKKGEVKINPDW